MSTWEAKYLGLGIGHHIKDDGMEAVVMREGKHHATFRGETAHMDAARMAQDMHTKARLALPDYMVQDGKHIHEDVQSDGMWYRQLPGDTYHTPMGN